MRPRLTFTAVMVASLVFSAAAGASQGQQTPAPPLKAPPTTLSPASKNPYADLFRQRALVEAAKQARTRDLTKPREPGSVGLPELRCGILVIPADPTIDPKIRVGPPASTTEYTMRIIEPPCTASVQR